MGNRAVIEIQDTGIGIYLHRNGGRNSIQAFLDVAKEYDVRTSEDYGTARLVQIIGNFFGGTLSVGIAPIEQLDTDNGDNGVYVIDKDFNIVERKFMRYPEQTTPSVVKVIKAAIKEANDKFFESK
tara:strand:+ start:418 stop:795 length:378 start_codon:yes stop_codon:yes gene_type:complete